MIGITGTEISLRKEEHIKGKTKSFQPKQMTFE